MADLIPVCLAFSELNLKNHLTCIEYADLGPADPREPSTEYWNRKMQKWQVTEGTARTRLCMNCAHYNNDPEIVAIIPATPGGQLKASDLPVTPKWADIEGMPAAVCSRWSITCSALRTCDDWEDPNYDEDNVNIQFVSPEKKNPFEEQEDDK